MMLPGLVGAWYTGGTNREQEGGLAKEMGVIRLLQMRVRRRDERCIFLFQKHL